MKKILIAFAAAAGLFCSTPALAQDGTASLYYQHKYDPAYQDARAHAQYGYGYYYDPYLTGGLVGALTCALFCHRPNPVKDNTASVGGTYYKACGSDPAVPINVPCSSTASAPAVGQVYRDGDYIVTVTVDGAGNQTIYRKYQPN